MTAWLENHPEWVVILALFWVTVGLFKIITEKYTKRTKAKQEQLSQNTPSSGDLIGINTEHGKSAGYGGGSGGGAGNSRSFVPPALANHSTAGDVGGIKEVTLNNNVTPDPVFIEGLSDTTLQTSSLAKAQVDEIPEIGMGIDAVEGVVDAVVEVAGELVEGVFKE